MNNRATTGKCEEYKVEIHIIVLKSCHPSVIRITKQISVLRKKNIWQTTLNDNKVVRELRASDTHMIAETSEAFKGFSCYNVSSSSFIYRLPSTYYTPPLPHLHPPYPNRC